MLEVHSSFRLMGGIAALLGKLEQAATPHGWHHMATAPTARGAWALLHPSSHTTHANPDTLTTLLDGLSIDCLMAAARHQDTLRQMGCRTLGELRQLPRTGIAQRFGQALLLELDQAYGLQKEAFDWLTLPDTFEATHDLPHPTDNAPALLEHLKTMLDEAESWLRARQAGATSMRLTCHPEQLWRKPGAPQVIELHTAHPTRSRNQWMQLFEVHFTQNSLAAAAASLHLGVQQSLPMATESRSWLPDPQQTHTQLLACMARLSARLGADAISRAQACADHRMERMQSWNTSLDTPRTRTLPPPGQAALQPCWLLQEPAPLSISGQRPQFQGALTLLTRPWRVETGWWDDAKSDTKDYFIAHSPQAGLVCVYRQRTQTYAAERAPQWFLHGFYG